MRRNGSPRERLAEILSVIGISAYDFENRCGMAHGFVSRVTHVITKKNRAKIKLAFPNINIEYIALGTGDLFVSGEQKPVETVKERIRQFQEFANINDSEFCKRCGLAASFTKNMSDSVRKSSLERIYRGFPQLNPLWLEYGEGDMMIEKRLPRHKETATERIDKLIAFLGTTKAAFVAETKTTGSFANPTPNITKATIDKIVRRFPFVNPLWLVHGEGNMVIERPKPLMAKMSYAPIVTQRAYAGYLNGYADEEYIESLDKVPYIETSEVKGNIIAFEVSGDSMDDGTAAAYRNGDVVLCRELHLTDYLNLHLPFKHYDFVVVHEDGVLIKQIKEHSLKTGNIVLHSLNEMYGDVTINVSDIRKIFAVAMRISHQRR